MALLRLERLGIPRCHRQGRHGDRLAPEGLWPVLELEDSPWQARPTDGAATGSPVDSHVEPRKIHCGERLTFTANCSSSASTSGRPASASTWSGTKASVTDLEDVPGQSPENDGVGGFLCRANDPLPDPIRVSGAGARAPAHPAFCSHRTSEACTGSSRHSWNIIIEPAFTWH